MTASDLLSAHLALRAERPDEDAFYRAYAQRPVLATPMRRGALSRAASFAVRRLALLFATAAPTR